MLIDASCNVHTPTYQAHQYLAVQQRNCRADLPLTFSCMQSMPQADARAAQTQTGLASFHLTSLKTSCALSAVMISYPAGCMTLCIQQLTLLIITWMDVGVRLLQCAKLAMRVISSKYSVLACRIAGDN